MNDRNTDGTFSSGNIGTWGEQHSAGVNSSDTYATAHQKVLDHRSAQSSMQPGISAADGAAMVGGLGVFAVQLLMILASVFSAKNLANLFRACVSWPSIMLPLTWYVLMVFIVTVFRNAVGINSIGQIFFAYIASCIPIAFGYVFGRKNGFFLFGKQWLKAENAFAVTWKRQAWTVIVLLTALYHLKLAYGGYTTSLLPEEQSYKSYFLYDMNVNLAIAGILVVLSLLIYRAGRLDEFIGAVNRLRNVREKDYVRGIAAIVLFVIGVGLAFYYKRMENTAWEFPPVIFYIGEAVIVPLAIFFGLSFSKGVRECLDYLKEIKSN